MEILRFVVKKLHNEEWFGFMTDFDKNVDIYGPADIGVAELYKLFTPLYSDADRIIQSLSKSSFTKRLEAADKQRDDVFRGFHTSVKGLEKLPDSKKQQAAEHLNNLLEGYKNNILKASYLEESSSIYNLLQDIDGKYEDDVELLGLEEWVTALGDAEKNFADINQTRTDESRDKPKESWNACRREIDFLYGNMINVIDAKLVAKGLGRDIAVNPKSLDKEDHENLIVWDPEKYGDMTYNFVVAWNEVVKKYRNLVSKRSGRHNDSESEDVTEE